MSEEIHERIDKLLKLPNDIEKYIELADNYMNIGVANKAKDYYNLALEKTNNPNQKWYINQKLAIIFMGYGETNTALGIWLITHSMFPNRPESMFHILNYMSKTNITDYTMFLDAIDNMKLTDEQYDGRENYIYECGLSDKVLEISHYDQRKDVGKHFINILSNAPHLTNVAFNNYGKYSIMITPEKYIDLSETLFYKNDNHTTKLYSSSPSIIKEKNGYFVNIRYVNYKLEDDGTYVGSDIGYVHNANKAISLDEDFKVKDIHFISNPTDFSQYDNGPQDVRLWRKKTGDIIYSCTTIRKDNNKPWVAFGEYSINGLQECKVINHYRENVMCEKNWVFADDERIIYSWSPIRIAKIVDDYLVFTEELLPPMPNFFKHFRGSSHGQTYGDNEILFVTHLVYLSQPRIYYHCFVTLDASTLQVKRYSYPFKLSDKNVEYCIGLVVEHDKIILSYSVHDSSTFLAIFKKNYIESLLIKCSNI
jgi:tetratricopeptide (TPR) repeat protein